MYIVTVHEKCEYDYNTTYYFDTFDEARNFLIAMQGVLICVDFYKKGVKA